MPRAIRPLLFASFALFICGTALLAVAQKERTPKPDQDEASLAGMKNAGYDLSKPYKLYFNLVISPECEQEVVSHLQREGFRVQVFPKGMIGTILGARKTMVPELSALRKIRRDLSSLIKSPCSGIPGTYNGWGFEPDPDEANLSPTDLCSLLPEAEAGKIAGQTYDSPSKSFDRSILPEGTKCRYRARDGSQILFIANVNPTRLLAVHRFAKLAAFFRGEGRHWASGLKGIGDEAYWNEPHMLLVRKGRVIFFLSFASADGVVSLVDNDAKGKQLIELARAIGLRIGNSWSGKQAQN